MRRIHKIIGLYFGIWLMLMGATGALLAFDQELDSWLNADLILTQGPIARPDVEAMITSVQRAYPGRTILSMERYGLSEAESYPFHLSAAGSLEPDLEVFVDPGSARIIGTRGYWTTLRLLRSFHKELFVPESGERVVGVAGVLLLTAVIAGVTLWWRENRRRWKKGLRIRVSAARPMFYRDLHTVGGIYVALFLAVQASSGAMVADYFAASTFVSGLFGKAPVFALPAPPPPGALPIGVNRARDIALAQHPASRVVLISLPNPGNPFYSVRLFPLDQPKTRFTRQYVIAPADGAIVMAFDPTIQSPFQKFVGLWMIWIHNGRFFGVVGQGVLVLAGSMLTLLFPTGAYLWLRRRRSLARMHRSPVIAPVAAKE